MQILDRIDRSNLEQREWHLWLLPLTVLVVFAAGMALVMYPTVFSRPVVLGGMTMRKAFFGLCAFSLLLVAYFVDRQTVIRQLRRQLAEEQKEITRFRHEASNDLLHSLPRLDHFRDRLVMECRRAAIAEQPLSILFQSRGAPGGDGPPPDFWVGSPFTARQGYILGLLCPHQWVAGSSPCLSSVVCDRAPNPAYL